MEFHLDNLHKKEKEVGASIKLYPLNAVSFIASRQNYSRSDLQMAPTKVKKRLMLTDSGWCRMGTIFIPPKDELSFPDLNILLQKMNTINKSAGRPKDEDLVIRTASKFGVSSSFSEPAFMASSVDGNQPVLRSMEGFKKVDYQESMKEVIKSWKIIHTDNLPLQKKAIHGRLEVNGNDYKLDLGTEMAHARILENGDKTVIEIPLKSALTFFNFDSFRPNNLTIQGDGLQLDFIDDFMNKYSPAGAQLGSFIDWVSVNRGLQKYVAEFRYYTSNCNDAERFHVMDLDINY